MYYRNFTALIILISFLFMSGCGATPTVKKQESSGSAAAKRFIQNVGAGEMVMIGLKRAIESKPHDQPGMAELMRRVIADVDKEVIINMIAGVYSRHLTNEDLLVLADFSDKPAIQHFFKTIFAAVLSGEQLNKKELMGQFTADELTEIMKLSLNDSFIRMSEALPAINKEMAQAGHNFGENMLRDYLKKQ
jgi:hypothetical protein